MEGKQIHIVIFLMMAVSISSAQDRERNSSYRRLDLSTFRKDAGFNQSIDFDHVDIARIDAAVFFVTNEQRVKHRLSPVSYLPDLEAMAVMHSEDMYKKDFFSHENPYEKRKRTPEDRAKIAGILNPFIAENIAQVFGLQYTSDTDVTIRGPGKFSYKPSGDLIPPHTYLSFADMLVNEWMNSPGHRKNILSKDAVQLGCGVYLYRDKKFNDMPTFKATQNFQFYAAAKTEK